MRAGPRCLCAALAVACAGRPVTSQGACPSPAGAPPRWSAEPGSALVERLSRGDESAIDSLGKLGAAGGHALLQLYDGRALSERASGLAARAWAGAGSLDAAGQQSLTAAVLDDCRAVTTRVGAAQALATLGLAAQAQVPALRAALERAPVDVRYALERTLVALGDATAMMQAAAQASSTESQTRSQALSFLWRLGPQAKAAVPLLILALEETPPDPLICEVLASIGDPRAIDPLIAATRKPGWRVALAAVQALAELKANTAAFHLRMRELAASHWLPAVREAASAADRGLDRAFIRGLGQGPDVECPSPEDAPPEPEPAHLSFALEKDVTAVLEVEDGWLIGTFRGMHGGAVVHRDRQGRPTRVAEVGVWRLLRARAGVVVVEAQAMSDEGNLSLATRTADGGWRVDHWLELPGPPHDAWVEASGRLRITSQAGTTLVDPDGTPHFESCAQSPPTEK